MLMLDHTRLDALQQEALTHALASIHAPIYLFGSRADLTRKGGDVDILILSDVLYPSGVEKSIKITMAYQSMCEEKIDVVIFPSNEKQSEVQKDFFEHITKIKIQ